jgi:hypothetical protein
VVCAKDPDFTLLGGFSTSNWNTPDPDTNLTIIEGQNEYRGVFLLGTGPTTKFRMEGFTIRRGLAQGIPTRDGDDKFFAYGGGMFVDLGYPPSASKEIVLRNLIFKNNKAIGDDHDPYGGSGIGGGLALRSVTNGTFENLTFEGNEARGGDGSQRGGYGIGGGFHGLYVYAICSHTTLINNIARGGNSSGSGRYNGELADGLGGGAATHGYSITMNDVVATGNQAIGGNATEEGGCAVGAGLFAENATLALTDAEVRGNHSVGGDARDGGLAGGGGIDVHNSNLYLDRAHVVGNTATGGASTTGNGKSGQPGGAGVYAVRFQGDTDIRIENSVIAANSLQFGAAGSDSVGGGGGGLWLQGTEAEIIHTTIAGNRLFGSTLIGNGLLLVGFSCATPSVAQIDYTVISDHPDSSGVGALFVMAGGNTANLRRTLWAGNHEDTNAEWWDHGTINDSDPLHASSAGFVSPGAPNYDYHILASSPARDQATGSSIPTDIDGEQRVDCGPLDIGADEYLAPALVLLNPRLGDQALHLTWEPNQTVAQAVHHYNVIVSCEQGASPPAGEACDSPINVGNQTTYSLTGLTNGKTYSITVEARDSANELLASAGPVEGMPVGFDFSLFLPSLWR